MNFYSHAVLASWVSPDLAFVLGSMLPDLCRMAGEKPMRAEGAIGSGLACHERADEVFHSHPEFRQLCTSAFEGLQERGVSRGGARAAAHIGVELLIDGWLYDDEHGRAHYLACADRGHDLLEQHPASPALLSVLSALQSRGAERAHTSPTAIARRIDYATRGRRRLALQRRDLPQLCAWAEVARTDVEEASPRMVRAVAEALGARIPESSRLQWGGTRG